MNKYIKKILTKFGPKANSEMPIAAGSADRMQFQNVEAIVKNHFSTYSSDDHICQTSMKMALELLEEKSARIVETGSSAWGTNSSLLFDSYVNSFGGEFLTTDIRQEPSRILSSLCTSRTHLYWADSIRFLKSLQNKGGQSIDFLYLDSWDVDWSDPLPSALHGLNEFLTIYPALKPGAIVLIDDTPADIHSMSAAQPREVNNFRESERKFGFKPGKGTLVKQYLTAQRVGTCLHHDYQLLWKI